MSFFKPLASHKEYFSRHGQLVPYAKGQYLVTSFDDSLWVFYLESGLVRASFSFSNGSERLLGYFLPGQTFAQSGSFFRDSGGSLEYVAHEAVRAYRIPRQEFLTRLTTDAQFNADYVDLLLRNQIFLIERIVYQGEQHIEHKFLRWLLFMNKYYGHAVPEGRLIDIAINQDDIANFLHVTRVSVSKVLKKSCDQGLLRVDKKRITLLSVDAIQQRL